LLPDTLFARAGAVVFCTYPTLSAVSYRSGFPDSHRQSEKVLFRFVDFSFCFASSFHSSDVVFMEFNELFQHIFVYVLSTLAIACAVGTITHKSPVFSALLLVINFFCIAGLYLSLQSEFLAVIQIIVYAGAIMVLFLFIIMLLNLDNASKEELAYDWRKGAAFILGIGFLLQMLYALRSSLGEGFPNPPATGYSYGRVEPIGQLLFTDYVFPFEMISVVLLAALIGAVVIAKRHR
jgi:NADH-quinone oxidoreductase subunit J